MATIESQSIPQHQYSNTITSNEKEEQDKYLKQNLNMNKTNPVPSKEIIKNKLNMNSSLNAKADTNTSLNEQKKKEQSDLFDDEDILYNDEDENEIFREYNMINDNKLKVMDDIKNIKERIKNNKIKIEELKKNLVELKEEKKNKQADIMNLLSNKESLEEIYKNQLYILNNNPNYSGNSNSNNFNENTTLANDINNLNNLMNDNSVIHLNSNHNITILDNEILNSDEDNFKITLKEIKESESNKYIEQVINMFEDIFKKKDENINNTISDIIQNSYELFVNNTEEKCDDNNAELSVNNFFSKMSLFIANQSIGKFSESKINLLLRYLLKINYINTKLTGYIKFVNKKYKERKKELNDLISFLEKKNLNLKEKCNRLENKMKEYDENKLFFDKNDNEELSHEVVIEYEDGIDKNVDINYEDDIMDDKEYDIEKQNEMMKKGLNPYNKEYNKEPIYKKVEKKTKQIIIKDNDESEDKHLSELLENKIDKKEKKEIKKKNDVNKSMERIKNNNDRNIINLDKNKRYYPTPQHHIKKTEEEINNLTTIEKDHYNRVQRIMNSGPKYGIFGVNKYNPDNNIKEGYMFSPKKNNVNIQKSSNKIDKTVKIESRQNHNFIGIINMTKVVPIKKKKKEINRKSKEIKTDENDGGIKIINLEQDFEKEEVKSDEKVTNEINNNKEPKKNEVQGYYLNIINSKKEKTDDKPKENKEEKESLQQSNSKRLNYKRSYKSARTRELNLNDGDSKRVLLDKMNDLKTNNNINQNNKNSSNNNSYSNNDISKRSHSLSGSQNDEENNMNEGNKNKFRAKKIIMMNNVNNNSPKATFKKKITNIPISKISGFANNKNYNANTYEKTNFKVGNKIYNLSKNK